MARKTGGASVLDMLSDGYVKATGRKRGSAPTEPPAPAPQTPIKSAPTSSKPRKVGLYVDEAHEDYFRAVVVAGLTQRPPVTLSSSAVVRLAMDRLMAEMTPDQARDAIVSRKPAEMPTPGRTRW